MNDKRSQLKKEHSNIIPISNNYDMIGLMQVNWLIPLCMTLEVS